MNLTGDWRCVIRYGKSYGNLENKSVICDMEILSTGENFSGISKDVDGFGINPDEALIKGNVTDDLVQFTKQYSSLHYYKKGKVLINKKYKGSPLNYKGKYDSLSGKFHGIWTAKALGYFLGIIPIKFKYSGTWEMYRIKL